MLWLPNNPILPKAPNQSPRIPLWQQKSHYLPKAPSQIRKQHAEFQSENRHIIQEFGASRILELLHKAVGKTGVTRCKSGNRQTLQEFCFAEFLSFLPLQRETQCLWQKLIAKALWHLKSPDLSKAVSQSPPNSAYAEFGNQNADFK